MNRLLKKKDYGRIRPYTYRLSRYVLQPTDMTSSKVFRVKALKFKRKLLISTSLRRGRKRWRVPSRVAARATGAKVKEHGETQRRTFEMVRYIS